MVIAFVTDDPSTSMDLRARRYQVVRGFCEYLATPGSANPIARPQGSPTPQRPTRPPHPQRRRARPPSSTRHDTSRRSTQYVASPFTPSSAWRPAPASDRRGRSPRQGRRRPRATGVLLIRQTKFKKDRYVPTHPSTLRDDAHATPRCAIRPSRTAATRVLRHHAAATLRTATPCNRRSARLHGGPGCVAQRCRGSASTLFVTALPSSAWSPGTRPVSTSRPCSRCSPPTWATSTTPTPRTTSRRRPS